jgi:hypothetical protein
MFCDGDLEELHAFAARIGLKRAWFQNHARCAHYDLTPGRREAAVGKGAVEVSPREAVEIWSAHTQKEIQMEQENIVTSNDQMVGAQGDMIIVMAPRGRMTREEALRHAAWLIVVSEEKEGQFDRVLKAVQST